MKFRFHLAIIIAFAIAGCATPTPIYVTATLAPTSTPAPLLKQGTITFKRYDGIEYYGTVYGHGPTAIIMANMYYGDATQWKPFVDAFDRDKFTAITFNYYQMVQADYTAGEQEVQIILDTLTSHGFKRVICMGASMGLSACASIAQAPEMVGIVLISGPNNGGSLDTKYPKLFISGKVDQWAATTQSLYDHAPEPKKLIIYPDIASHGTALFYAPVGDQFLKSLLDFVNAIP
jgi:hypothetical protein